MVIQNVSSDGKTTDLTFTVKRDDLTKALGIFEKNRKYFVIKEDLLRYYKLNDQKKNE